jgi:hypothetical protein
MRELGLCVTSAGAIRGVKRHVARLGLDTSHFTGQRRWSDAQLGRAVANAYSWPELLTDLGMSGSGDDRTRVKALDGELTMYVIPSRVIAGRVSILLHNYSEYIVGSAAFLMKGANFAA